MPSSIRIGRIAGIDIGLHWSWFIIFALLTVSLSTVADDSKLSEAGRWTVGALTSIVFFGSVLLHELAHSLVARRVGLPVRSITLFVFGGVSNLERESDTAQHEFWVAIVGPLTSLALGVFFFILWATVGQSVDAVRAATGWLALINATLFLFNMLPGFPLDGGRVLRSIVWWRNGNHLRATSVASKTGTWLAWVMIGGGLVVVLVGGAFQGVWLILIGFFLRNASESSYAETVMDTVLRGLVALDVATTDYDSVPPDLTLQKLVDEYVLRRHQRTFPVVVAGHLQGLITLADVKAVPQADWPATSVYKTMRSAERLVVVQPDTPLKEAVALLAKHDINQLPIVDHYGELLGLVTRGDLLRLIQVRSEVATGAGRRGPLG